MTANVIYDNDKDRKLLELTPNKFPIFINFIDFNSINGRKEAYRIKGKWAARANPFVEVLDDEDKVLRCFYSENQSAINQLIQFLNESTN
jgi:hypothetical protein